jgi:hypothetical protein
LPLNIDMSFKISCYTLFDITQTGVINRSRPGVEDDPELWLHKRNTQCNFDTIVQAVSLRSQPEDITTPNLTKIKLNEFDSFGFLFEEEDIEINCWTFDFTVQHASVYNDGITELGSLYSDCDQVPMIKTNTAWKKLPEFLDSSDELRNIYFKVVENDE